MTLDIKLNRRSQQELSQQLYDQVKRLVLSGSLRPGERIPSSRDLAARLKVSRPTVAAGLAQLQAEGYLDVVHGSGVYVSSQLPNQKAKAQSFDGAGPSGQTVSVSSFGKFIDTINQDFAGLTQKEPEIAFYCWRPALDQFPSTEWARIVGKHARSCQYTDFDDTAQPQGMPQLRAALSRLVQRFRGVACKSDQVIVVNGLNQGLDLAARLHLDSGTTAGVENPGYHAARFLFTASGAKVVPIAVDDAGLQVDQLRKAPGKNCRLLYVTPSHQFPTGATMPLSRRLELLQWAKSTGATILEDDYDSEFHTTAKPIPALMSLDKADRVIYLGALNQLMFPSLGLSYLIVPPHLVSTYTRARELTGVQLPPHLQEAIAEFVDSGHLDRHVKRLAVLYSERRQALLDSLEKHLKGKVSVQGTSAGVFVLASFKTRLSSQEILRRALSAGVGLTDTRPFYATATQAKEFILGFGSLTEEEIEEGVKRLARILR